MPRFIVKLTTNGESKYLMWSTVVDAPVTYGMSLDEFKQWYEDEYGRTAAEHELPERLERVEKYGTSNIEGLSPKELCSYNRAGPGEKSLTLDELWDNYCVNTEGDTNNE